MVVETGDTTVTGMTQADTDRVNGMPISLGFLQLRTGTLKSRKERGQTDTLPGFQM